MKALFSYLAARGYQSRMVPIHHLRDLQEDLEISLRQGLLGEEVYRAYVFKLSFQPPDSLPGARSIIVIAEPQSRTRFTFHWRGQSLTLDVPPTYLHEREAEQVRSLLRDPGPPGPPGGPGRAAGEAPGRAQWAGSVRAEQRQLRAGPGQLLPADRPVFRRSLP
jgi:hypothetical protein